MAIWKDAPKDLFLSAEVTMEKVSQLTFYFRSTKKIDDSYILRLDVCNSEVSFHHWKGWNRMSAMNTRSMDIPTDRSFIVHIMLHGDVLEAFIDDRIAIGSRVQNSNGSLAISARDNRIKLEKLKITHLPK